MNRLAFSDFHAQHFGPEQKAYWQNMLQQQQYYQQNAYDYYQYETDELQKHDQPEDEHYSPEEEEEGEEEEEEHQPSKEAIEIFQFSEAYQKEKELERISREKDDMEGMQGWQYDESTVLCSGGVEAPTTSLVLTQPRSTHEKNRIQEEMLNSAYLDSCRNYDNQEAVVLWPVLPFRF
ncbi:tetrahydrofolate synthase [Mucor velutinosus]|uniref:Tetrahydrofolate synthase n=1 Tax=Mucor velutinosus TaxID=708070 RepID=A0AAN7HN11_9FUNG|nr:tetrahydrofolate synthase [Mucor velutinosus]